MKGYVEDLLNRGWIKRSSSNYSYYSSLTVVVQKKDGSLRLYCDYQQLNSKIVPDRHTLPNIQDTLNISGGSSCFRVLDQGKTYHQSHLSEEPRHLTAFITLWGLFEWLRAPFGLTSVPAFFHCFMESCIYDY